MKDLTKLSPLDYLKIIYRRRFYVIAVFILVCIATIVYAWRKPDVYRSVSRIQVESAVVPQDYVRPSVRLSPEAQIASIRGAVQSRSFLERMIQDFQLFGYGVGSEFPMEEAVSSVRNNIKITTSSKDTFDLSFYANDPKLAQSFTQRMVETLIQSSTATRKKRAIETDQFLEDQLHQTEEKLAIQEDKIKQFKMDHFGRLPDQFDANMRALNRLDVQLASVENSLQQLQEKRKMTAAMANNQRQMMELTQNLFPAKDILSSPEPQSALQHTLAAKERELESLTAKYTPQYPDVVRLSKEIEYIKRKIADETQNAMKSDRTAPPETVPSTDPDPLMAGMPNASDLEMESIDNEIKRRGRERESILGQIRTTQARLNLAPALEQELAVLTREHANLKKQYDSLQTKKFQSQMTTNLETNSSSDTYRVIDGASLPEKPIFPNRLQIIGIGLLGGLVAGIGCAIGRELLDTSISNEDEVVALLNLPVLVTISEVQNRQLKKIGRNRGMLKSA